MSNRKNTGHGLRSQKTVDGSNPQPSQDWIYIPYKDPISMLPKRMRNRIDKFSEVAAGAHTREAGR